MMIRLFENGSIDISIDSASELQKFISKTGKTNLFKKEEKKQKCSVCLDFVKNHVSCTLQDNICICTECCNIMLDGLSKVLNQMEYITYDSEKWSAMVLTESHHKIYDSYEKRKTETDGYLQIGCGKGFNKSRYRFRLRNVQEVLEELRNPEETNSENRYWCDACGYNSEKDFYLYNLFDNITVCEKCVDDLVLDIENIIENNSEVIMSQVI